MLKAKFFQIAIIFCIITGASLTIFADTIRLKDGSVIKGHIVSFRSGQFTIVIGDGSRSRQMTFFSDEIDAIEFDASNFVAANTNSTPTTLPNKPNTSPANTTNPSNSNNVKIIVGNNDAGSQPSTTPSQPQNTTPTSSQNVTPTLQPTPQIVQTTATTTPVTTVPSNPTRPKPIQLNMKVLADNTSNGWTNAGWVVRKGQKIRITGTGRISLGKGNYTTPAGISSLADKDKLMQSQPTGELIAVIGDDNNDFIPIGMSKEFVASRDGALFLGINEGNLDDNSGAFDITIEIDPSSGN